MEIGPDKYKRGGGSLNQRGPKSCEIHYRGEEVQISYKVLEIFNISQVLSSLMSVLQDLIIFETFCECISESSPGGIFTPIKWQLTFILWGSRDMRFGRLEC